MALDLRGAPVLVVGAGIMGAGIAQVAAQAGHEVLLHDARDGAAPAAKAKLAATFDGLKSMAGHLRSRVGRALRLQFAPEIAFKLDESVARAARIETLLAGLRDGRPASESPAEPPAEPADPRDD